MAEPGKPKGETAAKRDELEAKAAGRRAPQGPRSLDVKTVRLIVAGLVGVAIMVFLIVSLVNGGDDSGSGTKIPANGDPVGFTESDLVGQASNFEHTAYWVGPKDSVSQYELRSYPDGRIYVRYLTGDAKLGDKRAAYLTVGTYAQPDASAALDVAARTGSKKTTVGDGFKTLTGGDGNNAYIVFDDEPDLQVEVYSPVPGEASDLVSSGAVTPVD